MAKYINDFSQYPTGAGLPADFTLRWDTSGASFSIESEAGTSGGQFVRVLKTASGPMLVSWNDIDADPGRDNIEVLVRYRVNGYDRDTGGVAFRGSGASSSVRTGYLAFNGDASGKISRYNSGSYAQLSEFQFPSIVDTWFYQRSRVNGTTLNYKVWSGSLSDEPVGWDTTVTDSIISGAGWAGLFPFRNVTHDYDFLSIGTNGDTADGPSSGVTATGSPAPASISPATGSASGSASTSGSPAPMSITPADGSATGAATVAGSPEALYLVAPTGSAAGAASAIGSPAASSLSAPTGSATGEASASGQPASLSIVPTTGSASAQGDGSAVASGSIAPAGISPPTGSAVGAANASGAQPSLSLVPATGSATTGGSVAAGTLAGLSLVPTTGSAFGSAVATGSVAGVGLTPAEGRAHEGTIQVIYKQRIRALLPDGKIRAMLPDGKIRSQIG